MANLMQKFIYNLSAVSPIAIVFSIAWVIQKKTYVVPIIVTVIGLILIILFAASFSYGKKKMASISIRVTEISANDDSIVGYLVSYMLPIVSVVIKDLDLIILSIVAIALGLVIPHVNSPNPNPLLLFKRYHFYKISSGNGISGYVLISKRILRNKKDVKAVKRMFDFLLIDEER